MKLSSIKISKEEADQIFGELNGGKREVVEVHFESMKDLMKYSGDFLEINKTKKK